jgi:vesicular inhibitory amino acid transporter
MFVAFGSIMFAFAGASTFPTIQADMKDRSKFNISALMAMGGKKVLRKFELFFIMFFLLVLFAIYFPMAAACYFSLGDQVTDNIVLAMSDGWQRITVEIMLLLHLISAYPIITNPPAQFFEQLLGIPSGISSITFSQNINMLVLRFQLEALSIPLSLCCWSPFHR